MNWFIPLKMPVIQIGYNALDIVRVFLYSMTTFKPVYVTGIYERFTEFILLMNHLSV